MTPSVIATIIIAILGSSTVAAVVSALLSKRRTEAETGNLQAQSMAAIHPIWQGAIEHMQRELDELRGRVAELETILEAEIARRRIAETLLTEHRIPLPPTA